MVWKGDGGEVALGRVALGRVVRDRWPWDRWQWTGGPGTGGAGQVALGQVAVDGWPWDRWCGTGGPGTGGSGRVVLGRVVRDRWPWDGGGPGTGVTLGRVAQGRVAGDGWSWDGWPKGGCPLGRVSLSTAPGSRDRGATPPGPPPRIKPPLSAMTPGTHGCQIRFRPAPLNTASDLLPHTPRTWSIRTGGITTVG